MVLLLPFDDSNNRMTDLGRITRTARPCLSLTPSLNCLPVTASGSISCHAMASGLYVLRLQGQHRKVAGVPSRSYKQKVGFFTCIACVAINLARRSV